jgi:crotonobetainyl-CoA:carnitine CoA-transferase CaiB-like acyl-CoA transferase
MAAYTGAFAVMMALYWRDVRGGQGQVIDLALYEPVLRASEASIPMYGKTKRVRERDGNRNPGVVPASNFLSADAKWVVINANTDQLWQRWARAMQRADLLGDERFNTLQARIANADALYAIIAEWVRSKTAADVVAILDDAKVPAAIVNSIADIFDDPHIAARENITHIADERVGGALAVPNILPKLSATPGRIAHLGPDLGAHNDEVYRGLLGMSDDELAKLKEQGII